MDGLFVAQCKGEHGDVVFLSEASSSFGDFTGGKLREVAEALESIEFTGTGTCFGHAIREQDDSFSAFQGSSDELIALICCDSERQRRRREHFVSGDIRGDVAGIGEGEFSLERNANTARGGKPELSLSDEDIVEACEYVGWIV